MAHLLDAIKKRVKVPRSGAVIIIKLIILLLIKFCTDTIDLCTPEGEVKELHYHNDDNAANFLP